jgi:heme A synthase
VVFLIVGYFIIKLQKDLSIPLFIKNFAMILGVLLIIQIVLGAMTILSYKEVFITTFHVTNGAAILGISFYISLWNLKKN